MRDRGRSKSAKPREEAVEKPRPQATEDPNGPPTALSRVDESSISSMTPGDVFLIDELVSADPDRESAFHAILACPLCGSQVLISAAQYFGFTPIICGARTCPGFFRIIEGGRFVYLPVN